MEQSSVGYPLLLLDNETLAYILGDGDFRFTNLKFDEAKAILDMNAEEDIAKCFEDKDLENAIYEYLGIEQDVRVPSGQADEGRSGWNCI